MQPPIKTRTPDHQPTLPAWKRLPAWAMTQVLGAPVGRALPARVRARIDAAQNRSEILIGWLQLGAVIVFGTLYALSPENSAGWGGVSASCARTRGVCAVHGIAPCNRLQATPAGMVGSDFRRC